MTSDILTGILPVLPTPFHDNGEVDVEAMSAVVRFVVDTGVGGVVFPGFASEVGQLTFAERQALLEVVVNVVGDRVPVIGGATASDADSVIANGRSSESLGVNWLMIQPPLSIGSGSAEVIAFFKSFAGQLPNARIVLQNAPAPRGSDLTPECLLEVVRAVPQIAYIKEETLPAGPSITALLADRPETLLGVIGGGGARYILDEYDRGACAAMPAAEISDLHVELDKAYRAGDKATARDLYIRTLPLLTLQAVFRMRLTKHTLLRRGILKNAVVRAPTPELDSMAIADIDNNLSELQLITRLINPPGVTA